MSNLNHIIFTSEKARRNWDNQIDYYKTSNSYSKDLRKEAVSAIEYLKEKLGNGFLENCDRWHPIYWKISNKAEHSVKWLIWIASSLKLIEKKAINSIKPIEKLATNQYGKTEGIPFVNLGEWLLQSATIKLEYLKEKSCSTPDIQISCSKTYLTIPIEVTSFYENFEWNNLPAVSQAISYANKRGLNYSGKLKEKFKIEEYKGLEKEIFESVDKCYDKNGFVSLSNRFVHLGFSPIDKNIIFNLWTFIHNYSKHKLKGLPIDGSRDLNKAISNRLKSKIKKFKSDKKGVVAINVSYMYFFNLDIERIVEYIKQRPELQKINDLYYGIVIWSDETWAIKENKNIRSNNWNFYQYRLHEGFDRKVIFIWNDRIEEKELEEIKRIFERVPEYNML